MRGFLGPAAVLAGMIIAGLRFVTRAENAVQHPPAELRAAVAVALVAAAVAMVWVTVHAVSSRQVVRYDPRDENREPELLHYELDPPLPRHRPEAGPGPGPGEDDAWTVLPVSGRAPAVALPGRRPARSDRSERPVPAPETEDVPW